MTPPRSCPASTIARCCPRPSSSLDTRTPHDILGHLIYGERTDWIPRAKIILAQGANRRFVPFDRFAQRRESRNKSLGDLLDEFAALRTRNLAMLAAWNLSDAKVSDDSGSLTREARAPCDRRMDGRASLRGT